MKARVIAGIGHIMVGMAAGSQIGLSQTAYIVGLYGFGAALVLFSGLFERPKDE